MIQEKSQYVRLAFHAREVQSNASLLRLRSRVSFCTSKKPLRYRTVTTHGRDHQGRYASSGSQAGLCARLIDLAQLCKSASTCGD